ncbi:MAG: spore coat protein CotS [Lachnospiraceae bacterium]
MTERYTEVLELYDMEVYGVKKGRGAWILDTDKGCRILKEYRGTVRRLEFEANVLETLKDSSGLKADQYVRSKEDGLFANAGDGTCFVLKDWFLDRECNLKEYSEIRSAVTRIGMLHQMLRRVEFQEEWSMGSIQAKPLYEEMGRHNREMKRARSFIRGKRGKSEFELCVIDSYSDFFEQAKEAADGLKAIEAEEEMPLFLCHGDLDHHHVLMGSQYVAIVEYNRMHLGVQAADLYRFMRKVMERHGWNLKLGAMMLDAYERVLPMSKKERKCLYYLFLYPEKYWKQLNYYYNANKAWIPARNTDKLKALQEQEEARRAFLQEIKY